MIVGRGAELSRLDHLLEDVAAGVGGRLLIVGEPGIGKSALLGAVARRAAGRGHRVFRSRCAVGESELPYALIDDVAHSAGLDELTGDTASARAGCLLRHLQRLCVEAPVLLLIDDVHEADVDSLHVLAQVLERTVDARLGAVLSMRPFENGALLAWPRFDLRGVDDEAGVGILRSVLGSELSIDVLLDLTSRQCGNPLALSDARQWLTDAQAEGREHIPAQLPCSPAVVRSWQSTLTRLPERARRALLALAVADGRPDLLDTVLRSMELTVDDLDRAQQLGLVVENGHPQFVPGLARSAVLAAGPPAHVRDVHRRAAEAAERLALMPAVIVHHWCASVATADAQVADRVEAQAERAEELDQLSVASTAWQSAALLSTDASDRVRRAQRGVSLVVLNGLDYADTDDLVRLLEGAELDDASAAWVEWLRAIQHGEADPVASLGGQIDAIHHAREAAPESAPTLLWDAAMNAWTLGRVDEGLQAAREYIELEKGRGTLSTVVEPEWTGTALLAAGLFQAGHVAEAMATRERAIAMSEGTTPAQMSFDQLLTAVFIDDVLLDTSRSARERLEAAALRVDEGSAVQSALYGVRAWQAKARGEWAAAWRFASLGRPIAWATGASGPKLGIAALTAELSAACGDDAQLKEVAEPLRSLGTRMGDARRLATLDRALGLRSLVDGRLETAFASLTAAADVPFLGRGLRDAILPARVDVIEVLIRMGRIDEAERRADDVRPLLLAMGSPDARALAYRVDALLLNGDEADAAYEAAMAEHSRGADPFERARTRLLAGEHLRRGRRRGTARGILTAAERGFDILGAAPWLARTRAELRAAGGQPDASGAMATLTPQEQAVAEAVATGLSNREVAEALFLSPRTVEYHLGAVYRKLGVHGRGGLAQWLSGARAAPLD